MKLLVKRLIALVAILPFSKVALGQSSTNNNPMTGPPADNQYGLSDGDAKSMKSLFNHNETLVRVDTARAHFRQSNPQLDASQIEVEFQKALIRLKAKGLLNQSGVNLGAAPSGWKSM